MYTAKGQGDKGGRRANSENFSLFSCVVFATKSCVNMARQVRPIVDVF